VKNRFLSKLVTPIFVRSNSEQTLKQVNSSALPIPSYRQQRLLFRRNCGALREQQRHRRRQHTLSCRERRRMSDMASALFRRLPLLWQDARGRGRRNLLLRDCFTLARLVSSLIVVFHWPMRGRFIPGHEKHGTSSYSCSEADSSTDVPVFRFQRPLLTDVLTQAAETSIEMSSLNTCRLLRRCLQFHNLLELITSGLLGT
jgi:hypothetical protein